MATGGRISSVSINGVEHKSVAVVVEEPQYDWMDDLLVPFLDPDLLNGRMEGRIRYIALELVPPPERPEVN